MRAFSAVRPTGELHIGNYLGAIRQWVLLQEKAECVFSVVDLHALTTPYKAEKMQENIMETATAYLAAGLNPEKCIFFVQSQVKEHSELTWLLSTICPVGELKRMTQYKEKAKQFKKNINAGLLNYPVLMAADILLYQTEIVPVGKDQKQHVELARTLSRRFNNRFGKTFKEPKAQLPKEGAKIMCLQHPKKKMAKTGDPKGCIGIFEKPETIKAKIMAAVTDLQKEIKYNPAKKPGISNLLVIYSLFSGKPIKQLEKDFKGKGYGEFKKSLANILIKSLETPRKKKKQLQAKEKEVKNILEQGRKRAQVIAKATMAQVRKKMGLV